MSAPRDLTARILRVLQRTADAQGNVTMLRAAENIAAELEGHQWNGLEMSRQASQAEHRAEKAETAIEATRDLLDGWEHDGPDDAAMHLLIRRVRETLDGAPE